VENCRLPKKESLKNNEALFFGASSMGVIYRVKIPNTEDDTGASQE